MELLWRLIKTQLESLVANNITTGFINWYIPAFPAERQWQILSKHNLEI
jgi:hypothetical protein